MSAKPWNTGSSEMGTQRWHLQWREWRDAELSLRKGFSTLAPVTSWLDNPVLWGAVLGMVRRLAAPLGSTHPVPSSIPSPAVTERCPDTAHGPQGANLPLVETLWFKKGWQKSLPGGRSERALRAGDLAQQRIPADGTGPSEGNQAAGTWDGVGQLQKDGSDKQA